MLYGFQPKSQLIGKFQFFLSNRVATEPAIKTQYTLSLFISGIWDFLCDVFEQLLQFYFLATINSGKLIISFTVPLTNASDGVLQQIRQLGVSVRNMRVLGK